MGGRTVSRAWRTVVAAGMTVVIAAGAAACSREQDGDGDATANGTTTTTAATASTGATEPGTASEPLTSYRMVVAVTQDGLPPLTETREVRRPYDARIVAVRADGSRARATITNGDGLFVYDDESQGWATGSQGAGRAADDAQLLSVLAEGAKTGLVEVRGNDTVAGRECTEYRTGDPVGSRLVTKPTASDHVDLCVDRTGIVLRDLWTLAGKLTRERVTTSFEPDVALDDATFTPESAAAPVNAATFGTVEPLTDDARANLPVDFTPPDGYTYDGGIVRHRPQGQSPTLAVVQRFRKGADLFEFEQRDLMADEDANGLRLVLGASELALASGGKLVLLRGTDLDLLRKAEAGVSAAD